MDLRNYQINGDESSCTLSLQGWFSTFSILSAMSSAKIPSVSTLFLFDIMNLLRLLGSTNQSLRNAGVTLGCPHLLESAVGEKCLSY